MARKRSREWQSFQNPRRTILREPTNPRLGAAMLEVVDNQIRDLTPPETKQTFDRLIADGYSSEEARRLIAYVVLSEINSTMREQKPFNEARYVEALHQLPKVPF